MAVHRSAEAHEAYCLAMQLRQMSPNLKMTWGYPIMGGLGLLLGLGQ
jgi:hypothetical protein